MWHVRVLFMAMMLAVGAILCDRRSVRNVLLVCSEKLSGFTELHRPNDLCVVRRVVPGDADRKRRLKPEGDDWRNRVAN
jgi:hypothetical protein